MSGKVTYDSDAVRLYSWYFSTHAMFNKGGVYWQWWNSKVLQEMIKHQEADGWWKEEGSGMSREQAQEDAAIYRTALCLLMLETLYKYIW